MTLTERIAQAKAAYRAANPGSERQYLKAGESLPGGNTRSVLFYDPFPLTMASGKGAVLCDVDGHAYVDFLAEFTAGIYGHSHPIIRRAIIEALDNGINLSAHNQLESRLAELVRARLPSIKRLRFTNSGTEANLLAIAAAKAFTGREQILVFRGGYHGGVLVFGDGNAAINVPHDFVLGRYNDLTSTQQIFAEQGHRIAGVLIEPMQGAGGCIPGDRAFLQALRELTRAHDALLIFDEVMTSRLAPGGLQGQLDIQPDLTTLGKYIGGGMSFGAFGGRQDVMALFDPSQPNHLAHAGTFNNNIMSMAAGIAGLSEIYTHEACIALNARGDHLRHQLNQRFEAASVSMQFTGVGSVMNLHATQNIAANIDQTLTTNAAIRELFFFHMLASGHYLARRGLVALSLPLTDQHLQGFLQATDRFIDEHGAYLKTLN